MKRILFTVLMLFISSNLYAQEGYALIFACDAKGNLGNTYINDATAMKNLLVKAGFKNIDELLQKEATNGNLKEAIESISKKACEGDLVVIYYSGHGGYIKDLNEDEDDEYDELLSLIDGPFIDDKFYKLWEKFKTNVRIVVLSDSCYSNTIVKAKAMIKRIDQMLTKAKIKFPNIAISKYELGSKKSDQEIYMNIVKDARYSEIRRKEVNYSENWNNEEMQNRIKCSVLQISSSSANGKSLILPGESNSLFTESLISVWQDGKFSGTYRDFHAAINKEMDRRLDARNKKNAQEAQYLIIPHTNHNFESEKPFSIKAVKRISRRN